jgi:hypothetical protein
VPLCRWDQSHRRISHHPPTRRPRRWRQRSARDDRPRANLLLHQY